MAGPVNAADSNTAGSTGNQFRYDPKSRSYLFDWSTKKLKAGIYRLSINLGDGVTRTVDLGLR